MYNPSNQRSAFSKEQDRFIVHLISQFQPSFHDQLFWKKISEAFNQRFPISRRSGTSIRNHYNNVLNPNLNREDLSKMEEQILIQYISQYGCSFKKISKLMNRTENSVKNYYYRYLKKILNAEGIHTMNQMLIQQKDKISAIRPSIQSCKENINQQIPENATIYTSKSVEMAHPEITDLDFLGESDIKKTFSLQNSDLIAFSFEAENSFNILKNQQIDIENQNFDWSGFDSIEFFHRGHYSPEKEKNKSIQMENYDIQRKACYSGQNKFGFWAE
jgi:hypothetical protein